MCDKLVPITAYVIKSNSDYFCVFSNTCFKFYYYEPQSAYIL